MQDHSSTRGHQHNINVCVEELFIVVKEGFSLEVDYNYWFLIIFKTYGSNKIPKFWLIVIFWVLEH